MESALERVNLTPICETEFLDMNDDCILTILEFLKVDDIYSLGSTCVRINQLAGAHFERKHSNEWINIKLKLGKIYPKNHNTARIYDYEEIEFIVFQHQNKNAQNYFSKHFRSIRVTVDDSIDLKKWFHFIESKCCKNLKRLELFDLRYAIDEEHGAIIKNHLIRLESIKISNYYPGEGDVYAGILQYCQNIKYFSIHKDRDANHCYIGREYYNQLKPFQGERHLQLKTIICSQVHVNFMRSVVLSVTNLQYLKLAFIHQSDIEKIYDDLKLACDNGTIGQLKLIMPKGQLNQNLEFDIRRLANLQPLIALHNTHLGGSDKLLPIRKMVNLNSLKMSLRYGAIELFVIITNMSEIPKLVELEMNIYWVQPLLKFYYLCLPFVQKSTKMKILKVNAPWTIDGRIYLWNLEAVTLLDKIRLEVSDAVPLTIRIRAGKDEYWKYHRMLSKIPVGKMVKINLEEITYISRGHRL